MKNNGLRAFVRFDGSGRLLPSSLILQRNKPKDGDWKEIEISKCCSAYTEIRATVETPVLTGIVFDIFCSGTGGEYWNWLGSASSSTTMQDLADLGNSRLSFLGEFRVDGSDIVLKLKQELFNNLACDGTIIFQIYTD